MNAPRDDRVSDPLVTTEAFRAHGLSAEDERVILDALGRPPTWPELGVFSVLWSEHCSYRATKPLLATLPTTGPAVVYGPGENAGVIALDDASGHALVFKIESHNHPSQVMPFHGAATGVGGILRDVFTMGATPIALGVALRFGRCSSSLTDGVFAGLGAYGNAIGVPTITGDVAFDEAFDDNVLVNAVALGVVDRRHLVLGRAEPEGAALILFGAPTGRDGIHGATMASAAFEADASTSFSRGAQRLSRTIQVGDPFMGKRVLAASVALAEAGLVTGMQDLGAAGLSSSTVEMAARAGKGLEMWLDRVPRRADGMTPYEVLLSESQERLVAVCPVANVDAVQSLLAREHVPATVIGRVTGDGVWRVLDRPGGDEVCCVPVALLASGAPRRSLLGGPLAARRPARRESFAEGVTRLDSTVRGDTLLGFEGDAGVVRVRDADDQVIARVALALGSPHAPGAPGEPVSAFDVGVSAVASACLRVAAVGARPLAVSDGLNFGAIDRLSELPLEGTKRIFSVGAELAEVIRGMGETCRLLGVPVVSGNVSLANQTGSRPIPPTPFVAAVGSLPPGHAVVRSRVTAAHVGYSVWLASITADDALVDLVNFLVQAGSGAYGAAPILHVVGGGTIEEALRELAAPYPGLEGVGGALPPVVCSIDREGAAARFRFGALIATDRDLAPASAGAVRWTRVATVEPNSPTARER